MKLNLLHVLMLAPFFSFQASSQICEPQLSVYFDTDRSDLFSSESSRLDQLIEKMNTLNEYLVEIYGFTDSDADDDYNIGLSTDRAEIVEQYIRNHFEGKLHKVEIIPKGESDPKFENDTEGKKKLNRRVDIVMFPVKDGKVLIRAKKGTELEIGLDYFGICPICESKPVIQEISSNAQARSQNVSLVTRDGSNLLTGGMMTMTHTCEDANPCSSGTVRIPTKDLDPRMKVWQTIDTLGGIRWVQRNIPMEFTDDGKFYIMQIPYFSSGTGYNCDVRIPEPSIVTPHLVEGRIIAQTKSDELIKTSAGDSESTTARAIYNANFDPIYKIRHISDEEGIQYRYVAIADKSFWDADTTTLTIPESAYKKVVLLTDTTIYLKRPWNSYHADLYIPVIDSVYTLKLKKGSKRIYQYKKPIATTLVSACSESGLNDCEKLKESGLRVKISKKNKSIKIKIKRSAVKNLK